MRNVNGWGLLIVVLIFVAYSVGYSTPQFDGFDGFGQGSDNFRMHGIGGMAVLFEEGDQIAYTQVNGDTVNGKWNLRHVSPEDLNEFGWISGYKLGEVHDIGYEYIVIAVPDSQRNNGAGTYLYIHASQCLKIERTEKITHNPTSGLGGGMW